MEKKKLRILLNSNSQWSPSGYGSQVAEFAPLLRDSIDALAICNFYGLEGGIIEYQGIKQYPRIADQWGSDGMTNHQLDFQADVVMTLQDIWVLHPDVLKQLTRWIPIVPIDHDPIPGVILERLKLAYRVIAMSKFGQKEMERVGIHSTYIPHSVNCEIFKPMDKKELRKMVGLPEDVFLFGMVSANKDNPPRKSFQEVLDAFKRFHDVYPNSAMYFHSQMNQNGGFNILEYAKVLGVDKQIYYTPPYDLLFRLGKDKMAQIYNMFDVLMCPSTNEGFGIPIIEAQAVGVPAIVTDITAMPEHIKPGKTGELVKVAYRRFTPLGSFIGVPSVDSIFNAMVKLYKADRVKIANECRKHILETYDTKVVWQKYWVPFLDKLSNEVDKQKNKNSIQK